MRIVVCEAQVPFVHGGAELHVRELTRELDARGYRAELRQRSVQVVSEERDPAARRGVAAARSERKQRQPIDLVIATKFPTYFVRHPNKVAWLFHQYRAIYELCGTPVQRLRPRRGGRRAARHADRARYRRCSASAGSSSPTRAIPPAASPSTTASPPNRSTIRRGWRHGCGRDPTATTCSRSAASNRSSGSISWSRQWLAVAPPIRLVVAGDGTQRANVERVADAAGVGPGSIFSARSMTTRWSISTPARSPSSFRPSTRISAT